MILVDASVWINYFNGISSWQTNLLDCHLSNDPIFIGDLILTEVLQGFTSDYVAFLVLERTRQVSKKIPGEIMEKRLT